LADALGPLLRRRRLPVLALADLDPAATVAAIGLVGASSFVGELLPSGDEYESAAQALSQYGLPRPGAVMPLEGAGVNGLLTAYVAASSGLPLVDADFMGRALPRLEQLSLAEGLPLTPAAFVSPTGEVLLVAAATAVALEALLRSIVGAWGGWGLLVLHHLTAAAIRPYAIVGATTRAIGLGHALKSLPRGVDGVDLAAAVGGRLIGSGPLDDITRRSRSGRFGGGHALLRDRASGALVRIEFENEFLLVARDGALEAATPDIVLVVDLRARDLIGVDGIRVGMDLAVVALPGPDWWWAEAGRLARVGPAAFGLATVETPRLTVRPAGAGGPGTTAPAAGPAPTTLDQNALPAARPWGTPW
jgi:DUF917 family protein